VKNIGIWIDHRKAVLVTIENAIAETREVISNMEKHVRYSGGDHEQSSKDRQDLSLKMCRTGSSTTILAGFTKSLSP